MWHIGRIKNDTIEPSGTLRGIKSMCNPDAQAKRFYLRLTTVIESDQVLESHRRRAGIQSHAIYDHATDRAGDHFQKQVMAPGAATI
jgi:hypothetical protein